MTMKDTSNCAVCWGKVLSDKTAENNSIDCEQKLFTQSVVLQSKHQEKNAGAS